MQIIFVFLLPLTLACEMASDATAIQKLNSLRNDKFGPVIDKQMKIIADPLASFTEVTQATQMLEANVYFRNKWFPLLEREVDAKKGDVGKFTSGANFGIHTIIDESNVIVAAKNELYWIQGIPTARMNVRFPLWIGDKYFFVCECTRKYGRDNVKWFRVVKSFKKDSATLLLDNK